MKIPFTNLEISLKNKRGVSFGVNAGQEMKGRQSLFSDRVSMESLFQLYQKNSDVMATIGVLGNYTGSAGWQILKNNEVISENTNDYLFFWNVLNSKQNFSFLVQRIVRDVRIVGNAFVEKVKNQRGEVVGLAPLDPRSISIVANPQGVVLRYVQRISGQAVYFDPMDILHFMETPSPENEAFGIGRLESLYIEAMTDVSAVEASKNWYDNDATPSSYLIFEDSAYTSEEAKQAIEDYFKANFSGAKNKGKTAFAPFLKEIKTVSADMSKFQYLDGRKFTTEKICASVGVPKFFIGLTDAVNNNNAIELQGVLYNGGSKPLEAMISEKITRELFLDPEIDFRFIPQDFRQAEKEQRALKEYEAGILTLRQYKLKTGQEITKEDEKDPNIDTHIFQKKQETPKNK